MCRPRGALRGGVPLMLGSGTGAELRQPLGYSMVGGLLLSQALTLYTTPVIFLYLEAITFWLSSRSRSRIPDLGSASEPPRPHSPYSQRRECGVRWRTIS